MSVETTLNGKYLLTRQIGAGAFGEVYVATDLTLKREVAVKLLKPFPDPNYEERFLSEARLTSQLTHAHTLTVDDFGQHEQRLYLVTELLKGESLPDHLSRVGRLSPQRVTELFVPICSALEEAHQMGLIHRDLKPDNLFLHRAFDGERLQAKTILTPTDPNGDYELRARNGNSPLSEAALFSRRAFTYHSEHVRDHCVQVNCRENRVATCNEPPGDGGGCPNPGLAGATCGCYDAAQKRCICWTYGEPRMLCDQMCTPVYEDVLDESPASYMANDGERYSVMNP